MRSVFFAGNSPKQDAVEVKRKDLKAVFFVKDFVDRSSGFALMGIAPILSGLSAAARFHLDARLVGTPPFPTNSVMH